MPDRIMLEDRRARLITADGTEHDIELREFIHAISTHTVQGRCALPLVDNVRWVVTCGSVQVYVVELRPELRRLEWIADDSPAAFGPDAVTQPRLLATPYIVLKVPFRQGQLVQRVELFYRNTPLSELDGTGGELYYPNLLNVSPQAYQCVCWFCTQYLAPQLTNMTVNQVLDAVVDHVTSGRFNYSSEHSEGGSCFALYRDWEVDPRVGDVAQWERASRQDPRWVLSVPWKTTSIVLGNLLDTELQRLRSAGPPATATACGNILLRKVKPR